MKGEIPTTLVLNPCMHLAVKTPVGADPPDTVGADPPDSRQQW